MKGITSLISILLFNTIYSNYIDTFFSYKLTGRRLSLRELLDEGIKKKDCSNMGDYKDINKTSFGDYVTEMNFKENGAGKLVVSMLTEGKLSNYNDAIKDVVVWVFMIALAIIILITWPLFICCCVLGCCCFNKNVKAGMCGFIYYCIAMGLYFGVVVSSIIGFTSANTFVHSFNGSTCSLINIVYHTVNGEEKEEMPKWIGVQNIVQALKNISEPLDVIETNYDAAFNNPPTTTEYDKSYKGDNTTTSDNIGTDVDARCNGLKNIYQSVAAIYPVFALAFKDDDAEGMKVVKAEYDGYITVALDNTNTMKPIAEILKNQKSTIITQLDGFQTQFINLQSTVTNAGEPLVDNFVKTRDKAFDIFLLAFKILYGIFVAFSVILMGLVTLYALLKCFIFKLPVHIIWNVVMLICILTLVIGALLGIVSFIFGAVSPVLAYVLEPEFLKTFGAVGGAETYVDVCLNGDGDLATKMNISATLAPNIERFNNISRVVETFSSALLNESLVYKNLLTAVDGYQNDLRTTTTAAIHGDNDITTLLNKINAITDTPACGHDYYVTNEAKCNENLVILKLQHQEHLLVLIIIASLLR